MMNKLDENEFIRTALMELGQDVPLAIVEAWTPEQFDQVVAWVDSILGEDKNVPIPTRPSFLAYSFEVTHELA